MNDLDLLSIAFLERRPQAAATILQGFPPEQSVEFLQDVPSDTLIPVIEGMASWPAARTLSLMPVRLTADILRGLPETDAETLLRLMSAGTRDAVIGSMPATIARGFSHKLAFPINTVGAWMDTGVPRFTLDNSVEHCLDRVRRQQSHLGGIAIVVDKRRHLAGVVEVEKLLTSKGSEKLVNLLHSDILPLSARATLWEVEDHEGWTRFPSLPVIDRNNIPLGALTHSALRAGTTKPATRTGEPLKFSILAHLGKAFFIALGGLLSAASGTGQGPVTGAREIHHDA